MYDEKEIEDSLEFCRDIEIYQGVGDNGINKTGSIPDFPAFREPAAEWESKHGEPAVRRAAGFILEGLLCVITALLLSFLITTYLGQHTRVDGISMEDTLKDKDYLIIDKITYRFHDPERFDIIVFPYDKDTCYIKRIIGLPGEQIRIAEGRIYVDGELLDESYGKELIKDGGNAEAGITLADDEYFVLGDNRNHSEDSRFTDVGPVKRSDITGRAWLRFYPFQNFGILKHT